MWCIRYRELKFSKNTNTSRQTAHVEYNFERGKFNLGRRLKMCCLPHVLCVCQLFEKNIFRERNVCVCVCVTV